MFSGRMWGGVIKYRSLKLANVMFSLIIKRLDDLEGFESLINFHFRSTLNYFSEPEILHNVLGTHGLLP